MFDALQFYKLVIKRAWANSMDLVARKWQGSLLSGLIAWYLLGIAVTYQDQTSLVFPIPQQADVVVWGICLFVAAGIVFVPIFLLNLISAPAILYWEKAKEAIEAAEGNEPHIARRDIAASLASLYQRGNDISREILSKEDSIPDERPINLWLKDCQEYILENLGKPQLVRFENPGSTGKMIVGKFSKEQRNAWAFMYVRLRKLEEFIQQHEGPA